MAKKKIKRIKQMKPCMPDHLHFAKNKMAFGVMVFIFGLIKYLGYSWEIAFMVIGALVFLKGLMHLKK